MTQVHLDGFRADVERINPDFTLAGGLFSKSSSLRELFEHLQATVNAPLALHEFDAVRLCRNPADARIQKYRPAIKRLVSVWGRGAHRNYPAADGFVFTSWADRQRAQGRFNAQVNNAPANLRPAWALLEQYDLNPFGFNVNLGPGYLHRYQNAQQENVDITARSLLLKAGLTPPIPGSTDNGYIARLELGLDDIQNMANRSIMDVGCGAAIFGAEMATLYNSTVVGIDLNPDEIQPAIQEGKRRYVRSMFYVKMLKDMGALSRSRIPAGAVPLIETLVTNLNAILAAYDVPEEGDVFDLAATAQTTGIAQYDYAVSLNLLCYFDAAQQRDAVSSICSMATRAVYLFSGFGYVLPNPRLNYDVDWIQNQHNCVVNEVNDTTHHIQMN